MARAALVLGIGIALLAPPRALAQAAPEGAAYFAAFGRALTAHRAGDRAGAIEALREAVQIDAARPEAVCTLAEAQRVGGDLAAALEGYQACVRVARASTHHHEHQRWIARGLQGVAETFERMGAERQDIDRLGDARTAWQEYVRFADGATQVASPALGRARITAIDQVIELERVTAEVRARIAARAASSSASSSSSSSSSSAPAR